MSLDPSSIGPLLIFALIVFAGYTVQTVTGFGSMLICVTLGALVLPIRDIVTLAVPISILQTGYIVSRHRRAVDRRLLLTKVLPLMLVGMAVGFFAFRGVGSQWLRRAFGALVLVLALRELWLLRRRRSDDVAELARPIPPAVSLTAMLGAGIVHGIYATGGPLLVYALSREGLSKHALRATLTTVWLLLNGALVVAFASEGRYDAPTARNLLLLLPAIPLGLWAGEQLHRRVDERRFRLAVFSLLVAAAISLVVR